MNTFARLTVPGLLLTAAIACAALQLASLNRLAANGISALTLAIVIGMVVGNTFYPRLCCDSASSCTACV
jgi:uncharacterized membrane protein YadS